MHVPSRRDNIGKADKVVLLDRYEPGASAEKSHQITITLLFLLTFRALCLTEILFTCSLKDRPFHGSISQTQLALLL